MKHYVIKGPNRVRNKITSTEGAKNNCLPLMASSVLFDDPVTFTNVPLVKDVITMCNLLTALNSQVIISEKKKSITIINKKRHKLVVPYKLVSTMRAGCLLMGSLLGKYQKKIYKWLKGVVVPSACGAIIFIFQVLKRLVPIVF